MPTYNPGGYFIILDTSPSCQQNLYQGSEAAQVVGKFSQGETRGTQALSP